MEYLVIAHRYGGNEYIFPVGSFGSVYEAIDAAKRHRVYRGGKYDHKVYFVEPGKEYDGEQCKWRWVTGPNAEK